MDENFSNKGKGAGKEENKIPVANRSDVDADAKIDPKGANPVPFFPVHTRYLLVYMMYCRRSDNERGTDPDSVFAMLYIEAIRLSVEKLADEILRCKSTGIYAGCSIKGFTRRKLTRYLLRKIVRETEDIACCFNTTLSECRADDIPAGMDEKMRETVEYYSKHSRVYKMESGRVADREEEPIDPYGEKEFRGFYPHVCKTPVVDEWLRSGNAVSKAVAEVGVEITFRISERLPVILTDYVRENKSREINTAQFVADVMKHLARCGLVMTVAAVKCAAGAIGRKGRTSVAHDVMCDAMCAEDQLESIKSMCVENNHRGIVNGMTALSSILFSREYKKRSSSSFLNTGDVVSDFKNEPVSARAYVEEYIIACNPTGGILLCEIDRMLREQTGSGIGGTMFDKACETLKKADVYDKPIVDAMGLYRLGYMVDAAQRAQMKAECSEDYIIGLCNYVSSMANKIRKSIPDLWNNAGK